MYSKISTDSTAKELPYPKLMVDVSDGEICLFIDKETRVTVIRGESCEPLGGLVEERNSDDYIDYGGAVQLSNHPIK